MSNKQRDSKRAIILQAATEEFVAKGYDGARTMGIAKRAGVGHPLLYYHFKTKKELFKCVVESKMSLLKESVLVFWTDSKQPLPEKIQTTIGRHFDFIRDNADYLRFQLREMERHPELFEGTKEMVIAQLRKIMPAIQKELDEAAAEGEIAQTKAKTLIEDAIALNMFFLLFAPTIDRIGISQGSGDYYEQRKKENLLLLTKRLKP